MEKQFIHGGNVYAPKKQGTWLDFSANINPLGLPESVQQTIMAHVQDIVHYPDPNGTALKEALCRHYHVRAEQLVLGNGAAEILYMYFHAYRGQRLILPVPSFSEYERAAKASKSHVSYAYMTEETRFTMPWTVLSKRLEDAHSVILGNPNNPTGTLFTVAEALPFIQAAKKAGTTVIVDESFLDFLDDTPYSLIPYVKDYDNLIVLRSLTKCFAVPGLRLGFAVMDEEKACLLKEQTDCWNVNVLAQQAGVTALGDGDFLLKTKNFILNEKQWLTAVLRGLPDMYVFSPAVNFILLRLGRTWGVSDNVCVGLRRQGILVRNCQYYPGLNERYIRVAVRMRDENKALIRGLQQYYKTRKDAT